jgi:hypothetical protein
VRALYLDTAAVAVQLLGDAAVERAWAGASVLPDFEAGGLAAHLARSVLQVEWYLDAEIGDAEPITAPEYYAGLLGVTEPDSALNRGVRQRAEEVAAEGHAAVLGRTLAALGRLQARLPAEPGDRRVEALGRVLLLDEYLKTRLVELTVHMDDLALSLGLPTPVHPEAAYTVAIETLVSAATLRSGPLVVLRALSRAERQAPDILRVL